MRDSHPNSFVADRREHRHTEKARSLTSQRIRRQAGLPWPGPHRPCRPVRHIAKRAGSTAANRTMLRQPGWPEHRHGKQSKSINSALIVITARNPQ